MPSDPKTTTWRVAVFLCSALGASWVNPTAASSAQWAISYVIPPSGAVTTEVFPTEAKCRAEWANLIERYHILQYTPPHVFRGYDQER